MPTPNRGVVETHKLGTTDLEGMGREQVSKAGQVLIMQ